ncbi:MAG TPA: alpha-2-macroglobulin family protein, partial [Candidatus Xenobia bacterium]
AVDEAIFALMPEVAMPIHQFFWGYREDQVATFLTPVPVYSAGSFQKVGQGVKIRKKFLDTAQWSPDLETGADGRLTLKVPLPDNLTTWRFTATAISKETRVGATRTTAVVRKPFMVRVIVPRFMTRSDATTVLTQVINETGSAQDVTVRIKLENLKLMGSDTWTGPMKAGETKSLKWAVTHDGSLPPKVTAVATTASGVSDGEEQTMGAVPWGAPQTTAAAGFLKAGSTVESALTMPADFDKTAGGLKVHLSPGIPGVVAASLSSRNVGSSTDEIAQSVYLASRVVDAVKHHGVVMPLSGAAILRGVQERIPTLYGRQTNDGGWSWLGRGAFDVYVSAQVVEALAEARQAGFLVDDEKLNRGAEFLLRSLAPQENLGEAVTLAHAAVAVKPLPSDTLAYFYQHRQQLDYQGQASLVEIFVASKQAEKARILAGELIKAATRTKDQAFWETAPEKYDWSSDSVIATAHVLEALCQVDAHNDVLEPTLRWLIMRRSVDGWGTEGETTAACGALLRWMATHGEQGGPMDVDLLANGQKLGHWTIETGDPQGKERVATIRPSQLRPGANQLELVAHGKGSVLYFWQSDVYPMSQDPMPPSDHGLAVNRQYFRRIFNYDAQGRLTYRFEPLHGSVKVGDQVLVVVKFASWHSSKYLELDDPLPAGFDASEQDEASLYPTGYQHDYISRVWFRDQKVQMYQDHAEPRIYLYTYMMRATTPGRYSINPATVKLAYYPEVRGNSTSGVLEVQP